MSLRVGVSDVHDHLAEQLANMRIHRTSQDDIRPSQARLHTRCGRRGRQEIRLRSQTALEASIPRQMAIAPSAAARKVGAGWVLCHTQNSLAARP
jgi:hypothetical protein